MNPFDSYLSPEQKLHIALCEYVSLAYKEVFYFHVHNEGKRTPYERYLAKRMGMRSGLPDLMIPQHSLSYHGLAMELKIQPNRLTFNQKQVLEKLQACGWKTVVCHDFDQAKEVIDDYLKSSVGGGCAAACACKKKHNKSYARS